MTKKLLLVTTFCLVMAFGSAVDAQSLKLLGALSGLGVSPMQAIGGTKALMNVAKGNLGADEFSQLLGGAPELGQVLEMTGSDDGGNVASALGGLRGRGDSDADSNGDGDNEPIVPVDLPSGALESLMGNADLVSQFTDLGMDASMIGRFAPTLLGAVSKAGGPSTLGLLRKGLGIL